MLNDMHLPTTGYQVWEIAIVKSLTIFNNRIDESGNISFKGMGLRFAFIVIMWAAQIIPKI